MVPISVGTEFVRDRVRVQSGREEFDVVWGWVRDVVDERKGGEWTCVRIDRFLGWVGDLLRYLVSGGPLYKSSSDLKLMSSYCTDHSANSRHAYSFPRIYAILNDGKKAYDGGKDGQGQEIGACSVSTPLEEFH